MYPTRAAQDVKINGEYLTADEYALFATTCGSTALNTVENVISSPAYRKMTDADKANAISYAYKYATAAAKLAVNPKANVAEWKYEAVKSGRPLNYILERGNKNPK